MSDLWAWLALAGLGAFHGLNPAMGWLFAVALGMHRGGRSTVLLSLLPLALGHAVAIAATLAVVGAIGRVIDIGALRLAAGAALIAWGGLHLARGHRHRARVGMQAGFLGLAFWSFLMALVHGAGLMLVPVFFAWTGGHHVMAGMHAAHAAGTALAAVMVHTLAMLLVTGLVAVLVFEWVGVAVIRRGWVNVDLLWSVALIAAGGILLVG